MLGKEDGRTLLMATQVEGCEATVADGEFFGCWNMVSLS